MLKYETENKKGNLKYLECQRCPECGSTTILRDNEYAEFVCENCGFVVASKLTDRGPEWRAFNLEQRQRRVRTGEPLTFTIHDKGLSTVIDKRDRDVYGKMLSPKRAKQMYRLRRWQRRIRFSGSQDRSLSFALSVMSKMAGALNLPKNVLETASIVYRKALKNDLIRGRGRKELAAAALYLACRQCKVTRRLYEVAEASGMEKKKLGRAYRFLIKKLNLSVPPTSISRYISKFSSELTLNGKTEEFAHKIMVKANRLRLASGKGPVGLAAAAIYIASAILDERRTQREVAETANITEVTIRNRYKELLKNFLFIISV